MLCGLHGLLPHHDISVLTLAFNLTASIEFGLWTTGINLQLDNKAASKGKRDVGKFYIAFAIPLLADHDFNCVYSCSKPGSVSTINFQTMCAEDRLKALYCGHHTGRKIQDVICSEFIRTMIVDLLCMHPLLSFRCSDYVQSWTLLPSFSGCMPSENTGSTQSPLTGTCVTACLSVHAESTVLEVILAGSTHMEWCPIVL